MQPKVSPTIALERPDTADAIELIDELEAHLASRYPSESRHGFSVQKLIDQGVAFFVLRHDATTARRPRSACWQRVRRTQAHVRAPAVPWAWLREADPEPSRQIR